MKPRRPVIVEKLLDPYRRELGADFEGYRNHCLRVFLFCEAFCACGSAPEQEEKIAVAAAFHDLGIWTANTFDYLPHSVELAKRHLETTGRQEWSGEITAMIEEHHKLTPWRSNGTWLVEEFRRADLVDLSVGIVRFGLDGALVGKVIEDYPNTGFHRTLFRLGLRRLRTHPFDPLPMMRW